MERSRRVRRSVREDSYREKGAGEVKVPKRDDLLLWPYGAVRKERRGGKSGGGEGRPKKAAAGGWGVYSFFLFPAIILYKIIQKKKFSGMMA